MFILEIIMDWVFDPLMSLMEKRRITGKWSLSFLFPVLAALGGLLWWLGDRYDIIVLLVFGAMTAVLFGIISIVTWIPREVEISKDIKAATTKESSKVENKKEET